MKVLGKKIVQAVACPSEAQGFLGAGAVCCGEGAPGGAKAFHSRLPTWKLFLVLNLAAGRKEARSQCAIWESSFVQRAHLTKSDITLIQSRNHLSCFKQIDLLPNCYIEH